MTLLAALLLASFAAAAPAEGLPPHVRNAQVQRHDGARDLDARFRALAGQAGPLWIGYAVPAVGEHRSCCHDTIGDIGRRCPGCLLEGREGAFFVGGGTDTLEADRTLLVLVRIEGGRIDRVRPLSWSCGLDFGGRPLHWLDHVAPEASLRLLGSFYEAAPVQGGRPRKHEDEGEGLLAAIASHAHPDADTLLEGWAGRGHPENRRRMAAFWMGNARGRRGYETLRRLVREDPSPKFREHVVFALSQSDVPEAVDVILSVARNDAEPHVRGQALFWLGQKAGSKAVEGITRAMENDPDTEVKEKAVFALSQLPKAEGVPLLIETARKNRNPEVRKKAMFWLGQSQDPRALAFFEEVLGKP
jgi:hypothetical protein